MLRVPQNIRFLETYSLLERIIGEIKMSVREGLSYLALGNVSTRIITCTRLRTLLLQIQNAVLELVGLISDPKIYLEIRIDCIGNSVLLLQSRYVALGKGVTLQIKRPFRIPCCSYSHSVTVIIVVIYNNYSNYTSILCILLYTTYRELIHVLQLFTHIL